MNAPFGSGRSMTSALPRVLACPPETRKRSALHSCVVAALRQCTPAKISASSAAIAAPIAVTANARNTMLLMLGVVVDKGGVTEREIAVSESGVTDRVAVKGAQAVNSRTEGGRAYDPKIASARCAASPQLNLASTCW